MLLVGRFIVDTRNHHVRELIVSHLELVDVYVVDYCDIPRYRAFVNGGNAKWVLLGVVSFRKPTSLLMRQQWCQTMIVVTFE